MRHPLLLAFSLVPMIVSGCAGTLESSLHDASESGRVPTDLTVVYDDHTPLSGGDRIEVTGEGLLRWWRIRPGFMEASTSPEASLVATEVGPTPAEPATIESRVTEEALLELVRLVLEVEPWEQRVDDDEGRLDQRRAVLRASVRGGAESTWEWHDALDDPAGRVAEVRRWAERVVGAQAPALPVTPDVAPLPIEPLGPDVPAEPAAAPDATP